MFRCVRAYVTPPTSSVTGYAAPRAPYSSTICCTEGRPILSIPLVTAATAVPPLLLPWLTMPCAATPLAETLVLLAETLVLLAETLVLVAARLLPAFASGKPRPGDGAASRPASLPSSSSLISAPETGAVAGGGAGVRDGMGASRVTGLVAAVVLAFGTAADAAVAGATEAGAATTGAGGEVGSGARSEMSFRRSPMRL